MAYTEGKYGRPREQTDEQWYYNQGWKDASELRAIEDQKVSNSTPARMDELFSSAERYEAQGIGDKRDYLKTALTSRTRQHLLDEPYFGFTLSSNLESPIQLDFGLGQAV